MPTIAKSTAAQVGLGKLVPYDGHDARMHLETIFEGVQRFHFRAFPDKGSSYEAHVYAQPKARRPRMMLVGTFDECETYLVRQNAKGCGIFVTVNTTDGLGSKKPNIKFVRNVVLDLDGKPLPKRWRVPPHLIVETSRGKYQCTWCVERTKDIEAAEDVSRRLANHYGGDSNVCDVSHVFRMAGFAHRKDNNRFLSSIVESSFADPVTLESFAFLPEAPKPRKKGKKRYEGGNDTPITPEAAKLLFKHFPVKALDGNFPWIRFAMALHFACGGDSDVAELFFEFCMTADSYNDKADQRNRDRWESFGRYEGEKLKTGTLIDICRDADVPGEVIFQVFNCFVRESDYE